MTYAWTVSLKLAVVGGLNVADKLRVHVAPSEVDVFSEHDTACTAAVHFDYRENRLGFLQIELSQLRGGVRHSAQTRGTQSFGAGQGSCRAQNGGRHGALGAAQRSAQTLCETGKHGLTQARALAIYDSA